MTWARFDDQFPINRKVNGLTDTEFRLHVEAIIWCARELTDGRVGRNELDLVSRTRSPRKHVAKLVIRSLWHLGDEDCPSVKCPAHVENRVDKAFDGWLIHDYFEYQFTKEQVLAEREKNAQRQKKYRDQQKQNRHGISNEGSNGVTNRPPSRPVPSRSSPSGEPKEPPPASPGPPQGSRGTRLPDDFPVTDDMTAWARDSAPSCGPTDHEAFCDYWRGVAGAKGRKADWTATWRNWMRREQEQRQRTQLPGPGAVVPLGSRQRSGADQNVADHAALAAQLASQENR